MRKKNRCLRTYATFKSWSTLFSPQSISMLGIVRSEVRGSESDWRSGPTWNWTVISISVMSSRISSRSSISRLHQF